MSGYSEYSYWKTDFVDIDVNYYGRKNSGTNSFSSVFRFLDSFYPNLKNNGIKVNLSYFKTSNLNYLVDSIK